MPYISNIAFIVGSYIRGALLGEVWARLVPVSASWRYRVSLQRKKCCQQILCLDDEPFSVAVCIDATRNLYAHARAMCQLCLISMPGIAGAALGLSYCTSRG
jgi:hypothetical protein